MGLKDKLDMCMKRRSGGGVGSEKNWMCALGFLLLGLKRGRFLEAEQEILIFHLEMLSLELSLCRQEM